VIDGVKAGMPLSKEDFMGDILRRKSGAKGTTQRVESDEPEILSGIFEGHTTGAPIAVIFRNNNTRSVDYEALKDVPRPGHADYTASVKWNGFNDPRGGGHFSGRLTLPLVAAGVIAKKQCGFSFKADLIEIGGEANKAKWPALLDATTKEGDSLGGIVECHVDGVPAGLGEPFFDSVESLISHAIFSIPGVRGIEFGDGFAASRLHGSEHNDPLTYHSGSLTAEASSGGPTASPCEAPPLASQSEAPVPPLNVPRVAVVGPSRLWCGRSEWWDHERGANSVPSGLQANIQYSQDPAHPKHKDRGNCRSQCPRSS